MHARLTLIAALGALLLLAAMAALSRERAQRVEDESVAPSDALRLVSFSPALSRTLVDFGLEDAIVGRSRFCSFLDPEVPVVGDLLAIDYERLLAVRPTHVLVQLPATGTVDAELERLASEHGWAVRTWRRLDRLDDVRRVVREIPAGLAADGTARRRDLEARADALLASIDAALAGPASDDRPRWTGAVLLVHETDPVGVFGRATYLDDVLVALGASNALTTEGWATLTLEDVVRLDPPAIVLVRAGADAPEPAEAFGPLADLDVEAVRAGRLAVLADPDVLYPCPAVAGAASDLRRLLERFGEPGS